MKIRSHRLLHVQNDFVNPCICNPSIHPSPSPYPIQGFREAGHRMWESLHLVQKCFFMNNSPLDSLVKKFCELVFLSIHLFAYPPHVVKRGRGKYTQPRHTLLMSDSSHVDPPQDQRYHHVHGVSSEPWVKVALVPHVSSLLSNFRYCACCCNLLYLLSCYVTG